MATEAHLTEFHANIATESKSPKERLLSLDVLRGVTVAIMIVVNNSGDSRHTYQVLAHSRWNGCTIADLVFPCFLFMVGVSSVFSVSGRLKRNTPRKTLLIQALKRSLIIILLGLIVNGFPFFPLHTLRFYGVLQRIGFCYFVGIFLLLFCRSRELFLILGSVFAGYWALLHFVPVPGLGTPGVTIPFLDPHANLAAWFDRWLIPANHLYRQGFYDPEGFLSSLSATGSTLLGILTGKWLRSRKTPRQIAYVIVLAGLTCMLLSVIWMRWYPWNKRLWTGSFELWTGGISLLALAVFYWLLDIRRIGQRFAYPAIVFGMNALTAYVFSELLTALVHVIPWKGISLYRSLYYPIATNIPNQSIAALVYALLFLFVCFVPVCVLYRRKIFLKA
jgi:predicted acyltransferase